MDLSNILAISGKPDLNELISRTKSGAIVKNLVTGQKFPVFTTDSISQLSEIRMFTLTDEKPLEEVLQNIYTLLEAKPTAFEPKKTDNATLFDLLGKVLPEYDTERVHASDAKKLFHWYNVLLAAGKLTPTEESESPAEAPAEKPAKTAAEKPVKAAAKKPAAKKPAAPKKEAAPKATKQAKSAPKRTTTAKKAI